MEKISYSKLEEIKNELTFYDFDNLNSIGCQIIIQFKDDVIITRYGDLEFGGSIQEFESQTLMLANFIMEIIKYFDSNSVIAAKYESSWIKNKNESQRLTRLFKDNNIRTNFSGALKITDIEIIKDFIYSNFKYNSFTYFIFSENKIILIPSDHLDIFIASDDIEDTFNVVNRIAERMKVNQLTIEKMKI